ncbi:MAG: hypothetical protein LC808_00715 [Actinobacteria bacterium]|nr:hypothetical protein [Actinomycetota bacterium]
MSWFADSPRGVISFADALIVTSRLGATDAESVVTVVRLLGLTLPPEQTAPLSGLADVETLRSGSSVVASQESTAGLGGEDELVGPLLDGDVQLEFELAEPPEWVHTIEALERPRRMGAGVAVPPPIEEPLVRASMRVITARRRPGRRVDVAELVERSSRAQSWVPLPVLEELKTAPFVQILIDRGEGMQPYLHDTKFLGERLVQVAGNDRSERRAFVDNPLLGVDPNFLTGARSPWSVPEPGSIVVATTNLGHTGPEWRAIADELSEREVALTLLTPTPRERWPVGLDAVARIICWDELADLVWLT